MAELRYQAVLAVIEDGLQVTEAAAKAGVTRQALHVWLSHYAEGRAGGAGRSLASAGGRIRTRWSLPSRCGWWSCADCIRAATAGGESWRAEDRSALDFGDRFGHFEPAAHEDVAADAKAASSPQQRPV